MKRPRLLPLLDWIPSVSPRFFRPTHLAEVAGVFRQLDRGESVEVCFSFPPRHLKTSTLEHGVARWLRRDPSRRVIWASYGQRFAERSSRRIRELGVRVGLPLAKDAKARANWRTGVGDGGMWCTSVGGPITGEGCDLLVVDDPVRGRAQAESSAERERIAEWFSDDAYTRLEPGGSCLVSGARWHEDDLIGRLVADGWDYVRRPALDEHGVALCPQRYSAERLCEIRDQLGPYGWASLYQGRPQPRAGLVFSGDVQFFDPADVPPGLRIAKGVDLAYSAKTRADHSAAIVLGRDGSGRVFVLDVLRAQTTVDHFIPKMRVQSQTYAGRYRFYASTTELGIGQVTNLLAPDDVRIHAVRAAVDKFSRAQPVAAAFNSGKILLPREAAWLDDFVHELKSFSGANDKRDDLVDAFAAAFDDLTRGPRERSPEDEREERRLYGAFPGRNGYQTRVGMPGEAWTRAASRRWP